jgi:hypothetical protein
VDQIGQCAVLCDRNRPELGEISPLRQFNHNGVAAALGFVILGEFRPEPPGLDTDNSIRSWIERIRSPENINAQQVFLQRGRIFPQTVLDDKAEKSAKAGRIGQGIASQDAS